MEHFNEMNVPKALQAALARMNFTTPTPIQAQAIPLALEGRDILGSAQTGTGKTAAYGIPLVAKVLNDPRCMALVLTPTRELAVQVIDVIHQLLGQGSPVKTALLIGGESIVKQLQQLKMRPRIIVGTPGRINDHLTRGSLMLHFTGMLVLDETDRMLDLGFGVQLEKIAKYLPQQRQTLMFSATMPQQIVKLSQKYLQNPERIAVGHSNVVAPKVKQEMVKVSETEKYGELLKQLQEREGSVIVFVKTKRGAEKLADRLCDQNYSADAIHGDLQQRVRDRVIAAFRNKKYRIMVATDIAARGLDIPHIEHVINYDLPQCPEDYIHRIGRTGRAGAEGSAVNLITPQDGKQWRAIHRMLNPDAPPEPRDRNEAEAPRRRRKFGGGNGGAKRPGGFGSQNRGQGRRDQGGARAASA